VQRSSEPAVLADDREQLVARAGTGAKCGANLLRRAARVGEVDVPPYALEPREGRLADRFEPGPVVTARDYVDGAAEEARLDQRAPLQRTRQLAALESFDPRPQPDVCRGCVLRLHSAHLLDCPRQRRRRSLKE